jgi:uncharacterized Zn finger protein
MALAGTTAMKTNAIAYAISPHLRALTHEQVALLDREVTEGMSWDFYCGSYIRHPTVLGKRVSGLVGDEIDEYFAEVQVDGRQLKTGCSCGSRSQICKHAVALLYGWVNDTEGFQNVAEILERLRTKDKESIIEIIGRILMFDHRNLSFLDEDFAEEDFDKDGL